MPWLNRDRLLFVHVPRCGGTSLTTSSDVFGKARQGESWFHKLGLYYFQYRYDLAEQHNFPVLTIENLLAFVQIMVSIMLFVFARFVGAVVTFVWGISMFLVTTFLYSPPVGGRNIILRRFFMLCDYVLCGWSSSAKMMTGINRDGWLIHFTASKMLHYGYASNDSVRKRSFAIVRNPYARFVSVYHYNSRFNETIDDFARWVRRNSKAFVEHHNTEDWDVYCHVLPMYAYTHDVDTMEQLVPLIFKLEELKASSVQDLLKQYRGDMDPIFEEHFTEAINKMNSVGTQRKNHRPRRLHWTDYYSNPETLALVRELYAKDFELFGYDIELPAERQALGTAASSASKSLPRDLSFKVPAADAGDEKAPLLDSFADEP